MRGTCERCPAEAHGRFCPSHRREHADHLQRQLGQILDDHAATVASARARSAALIPETCGHSPLDLRVIQGGHYCGRCLDLPASEVRP